jgi:glycosyltransferase involved in cell wall biosynthesis
LRSALDQDRVPAEVLLVDDGNDASERWLLESLSAHFAEQGVRLLRLTSNQGPAAARNAGWDHARQPYVAFLDADDSWHRRKLALQYGYMAGRPELVLTGHSCHEFNASDAAVADAITQLSAESVRPLRLLLSNCFSTPSVMLRRDLKLRFDTTQRYSEDYLLWCQLVLSGHTAERLSPPLAWLHKPAFGAAGLSGRLWSMELGELMVYRKLAAMRLVRRLHLLWLLPFSLAKYLRRVGLVGSGQRRRQGFNPPAL